jgi:hypothetical protein
MGYRKQLSIRTECLNAMGHNLKSMHHTRTRRLKAIEQAHLKSMQHRISQAPTIAEKRAVVAEVNPLFYVFGEKRKVFKPYLTYEENYDLYI